MYIVYILAFLLFLSGCFATVKLVPILQREFFGGGKFTGNTTDRVLRRIDLVMFVLGIISGWIFALGAFTEESVLRQNIDAMVTFCFYMVFALVLNIMLIYITNCINHRYSMQSGLGVSPGTSL